LYGKIPSFPPRRRTEESTVFSERMHERRLMLVGTLVACAWLATLAPRSSAQPPPHLAPTPTVAARHVVGTGLPGSLTHSHGKTIDVQLPGGRRYVLNRPPADPTGRPRPLVIALHGMYLNPAKLARDSGLSSYADRHGFLVAYGVGISSTWRVGDNCCGEAGARKVDDGQYLLTLLDDLSNRYPVDRSRVYLVGFSAGDSLAIAAQCEYPGVFAASAGSSGAMLADCVTDAQIRVLHLHGRHDRTVPYRGGRSGVMEHDVLPATWLAAQIRQQAPNAIVDTRLLSCGHQWPRLNNDCHYDATDLIWRWLSRYSR
jgi:polyhydroxybutyrate depolymerase